MTRPPGHGTKARVKLLAAELEAARGRVDELALRLKLMEDDGQRWTLKWQSLMRQLFERRHDRSLAWHRWYNARRWLEDPEFRAAIRARHAKRRVDPKRGKQLRAYDARWHREARAA